MPDPETPTNDPELAAANREALLAKARKERAEAEKSIAEAEQARLKTQLSPLTDQSTITAPSGDVTTTTDQAGFVETQMLAQQAARVLAGRLKDRLTDAKVNATTVIIYNSDVASLSAMASVLRQLEQFAGEFAVQDLRTNQVIEDARSLLGGPQAAPQPELARAASALILGPSIATGVVKSVAELVNLFRATTEFKRQTVAVTEEMIVSILVNKLGTDRTVYYPAFFPPNVDTSGNTSLGALRKLNDNRIAAQSRLEELAQVEAELNTKMLTAPSEAAKLQSAIKAIGDLKSELQSLIATVDQLSVSLETTDPITKDKPISQLIRAERLASIMKEKQAFTLHLTVTANGTSTIRKNLFTSARVQHSAGVSLVYQLFDLTGKIVDADAMQHYFDFKTSEEVRAETEKT